MSLVDRGTKIERAEESIRRTQEALDRNLGNITEQDWRVALQDAEARLAALRALEANFLPNGCTRERAEQRLAMYDMRAHGGYRNQVIAERDAVKRATGMGVRELRTWLADNPVQS